MLRRAHLVILMVLTAMLLSNSAYALIPPEKSAEGAPEEVRMHTAFSPPSQVAQDRWGAFVASSGEEWEAVWNPATETPHRAYGPGIKLANAVTDANVRSLVDDFVSSNAELLGTDMSNLELISSEKHGSRWYTDYQQVYRGLDVIGGRVHVRLKEDGSVTVFGSDVYPGISISPVPSISEDQAFTLAADDVEFDVGRDQKIGSRLVVLPVERGSLVSYHLAYEMRLRVERGPAIWRIYVDADSGMILRKANEIYYDAVFGEITGNMKPMYITQPDQEVAFTEEYVTVTGWGQDITDETGAYSIEAGSSGNREVTAGLAGPWAVVTNNSGPEASFVDSVPPGTQADILWDDSNSRADERNAFYHAVVVHAKIKEIDPSFTGMDRQTPVRVNQPDYCNAYWDGNGITLGAGTGTCNNLAMFSDVIYHEYGHGIVDFLYRPLSPSGAMHEAFADYTASTITNEPYIGEGVIGSGYFRCLDNNLRYPDDLTGEVHDDGRILGGALWDMRQALSPDVHLADSLWHYARYGKADNFFDYYYDVLETDDDDGDLSNGTPHFYEIAEAFGGHGIGPGLFINIAHNPLKDCEDSTSAFPVVATITSNMTLDPDSLVLYYSTGGGYTQIPMTPTAKADEYSATIPAQPYGTSVDYYIYARASGRDDVGTDPAGAPGSIHAFAIGDDSEPPVIAHTPMGDQPDAGWPSTVVADVTDNLGVGSVMLEYWLNGAPQAPIPMTNVPGSAAYEATFAAGASSGDYIEYRILATDASASLHTASDPAVGYHIFAIATAYHYTFETGEEGWTHTTTSGWSDEWHLSTQRNHTGGGSTAWKCGSTGTGDYGTRLKALLETPVVDFGENSMLVFWHWIDAEDYEPVQGSGIAWDGAALSLVDSTGAASPIDPVDGYPYRMIPDGEAPFTNNKPVYSGQSDWQIAVFDLSGYTGPGKIRFKFGSDSYVGGEGWYIDDVMIWSSTEALAGLEGCDDICDLKDETPPRFALGNPFPNPAKGTTDISYAVPSPGGHVSLKVFDVTGRLTATLIDEHRLPGRYSVTWNGRNGGGSAVSPGIYFVRMQSGDFSAASKVMLLR